MKRFVLFTMIIVTFVTMSQSHAGEIIQPPQNTQTLIGKIISFTDNSGNKRNVWNFPIIGTSEHFVKMSKAVILYINNGVNYWGQKVKQISFNADSYKTWWQIEFEFDEIEIENKRKEEIYVLSIE